MVTLHSTVPSKVQIFQFFFKRVDWKGGYCLNLNQSVQYFVSKQKLCTPELNFEAKIAGNSAGQDI